MGRWWGALALILILLRPSSRLVTRVRAFSLLLCTGKSREVRLFLRKSRAKRGCPVGTRSENALADLGRNDASCAGGPVDYSGFAPTSHKSARYGAPQGHPLFGVPAYSLNSRTLGGLGALNLHKNRFTLNSYGVNCNPFLRVVGGPGRGVEGPGMPGANHLAVFNHPFSQRAPMVRTLVVQGTDHPTDIGNA